MIQFNIPEKVAKTLNTQIDQEYNADHCKIVYMVSLFGQSASGPGEPETWIRQHPLWVYLYEGIVAEILEEPDYAPSSVLVSQDIESTSCEISFALNNEKMDAKSSILQYSGTFHQIQVALSSILWHTDSSKCLPIHHGKFKYK